MVPLSRATAGRGRVAVRGKHFVEIRCAEDCVSFRKSPAGVFRFGLEYGSDADRG